MKERIKLKDKFIINNNIIKYLFISFCICFAIPSIVYLIQNKTVLNFNNEFCFLLNNQDRLWQAIVYGFILAGMVWTYYLIIKKRNTILINEKQIYKLTFIVSLVFVLVIPFWSSDVFYYMGIGRLQSEYNQNPYYVTVKEYVENNETVDLQKDTVMNKGYTNYWANTTVVYGPVWTIVCSIISKLSFGNINLGLLIFKLINVLIHVLNCYLIYKISNKKIFSILYGLNPFILIEGIAHVHNDIFVIFFILLSLYQLLKKKNIILSVICLALATDIKYFAILLLPLIVIYYFRDKDIKIRIIKCIQYGVVFLICAGIPYILFAQNMEVFAGLGTQNNKITKGLYLFISEYFKYPENLINIMKQYLLGAFVIVYFYICTGMLIKKKIKFGKEMQTLFCIICVFLFLLITNFQPWYLMWFTPFMMWQKPKNIKLINQMQIMSLIANMVFLVYSENYKYGVPFFFIFVAGTLLCYNSNKKEKVIYVEKKG